MVSPLVRRWRNGSLIALAVVGAGVVAWLGLTARPAFLATRPTQWSGTVVVSSTPPGALIYLDREERPEVTPARLEGLSFGSYELWVTLPGHEGERRTVHLSHAEPKAELAVTLRTLERAPLVADGRARLGSITVSANIAATLAIDGEPVGPLPITELKLAPGVHSLHVESADKNASRSRHVYVRAGEATHEDFVFPQGKLEIRADPYAEVWLNGSRVGQTPLLDQVVHEGQHTLRFVWPGGERTVPVQVTPGQTLVVTQTFP